MANAEFVRGALTRIERHSLEQDQRVVDRLAASGFAGQTKSYPALRAAAQAMLRGEAARASAFGHGRTPKASWGSWVEGMPLAHALLFNDGLIVDLIPCPSEAHFVARYKCRPEQFLDILWSLEDSGRQVFINLRDFNPVDPASSERYVEQPDSVRNIFTFLDDKAYRPAYLNAYRVDALLKLFDNGGKLAEYEGQLAPLGRQLAEFLESPGAAREYPGILVRGANGADQLPVPIQIIKRMAYHLAFSDISPDIPRHPTMSEALASIAAGKTLSTGELATLAQLATELHHAHTAPLTGAYGGTYNLTEKEAAPRHYDPIGRERSSRNQAYLDFLYGTLSRKISPKNAKLKVLREVSGSISVMQDGQAPSDRELRAYLDMLPESRDFLRKREDLERALRDTIQREDGDLDSIEAYLDAANKSLQRVNGIWSRVFQNVFVGFGATVAGGGTGVVAASLGLIASVFETAMEKAGETFGNDFYDQYLGRRNDAKQIVRIVESL